MVFLELRRGPGVHFGLTAGIALQPSFLFNEVRTPVELRGTPQESLRGLAGQKERFSR